MTPLEILHTYFGYDEFRSLQAQIIDSVMHGRDTLALMPTGGGKSLCFQVPTLAMVKDDIGLCLVVTPLIALMKDQIENLRRRDIRATAIYTGMSYDQQRMALDNCLYGPYRFLYVSPERLESEEFRKRLADLPIVFIAVDEAHCISQWGYDFRPSYLRIAQIRTLFPTVPVLALTATATLDVVDDIQDCLQFREKNVFRKSFHRDNLRYVVRHTDKKYEQLLHILTKTQGSTIVYVRNRKRTRELAEWLTTQGITADYYNGGMTSAERTTKQESWKADKVRVIVATNAFGMGIDKPDVRLVVHLDLPDTIEAYFQEAGRAGRDGKKAYAVLLYDKTDKTKAKKRIHDNYPEKDFISDVYHKMSDYLQIGAGSGLGHSFAVHIDDLCKVMHLPLLPTHSALHLLNQAGYIGFAEEAEMRPRVRINVPRHTLDTYTLDTDSRQTLISFWREYAGIGSELQWIRTDIDSQMHSVLVQLAKRQIITYIPQMTASRITFVRERQIDIFIPPRIYEQKRQRYIERLQAMIEYAEHEDKDNEKYLLRYFGEE